MNSLDRFRITLLNAGKVDLDNRWDYDNVISPFSRLYLVTQGQARVYHHNQVFHLRPGYLYLIPSYTYSRYICDDFHTQYYLSFLEECGDGLSAFDLFEFHYEMPALPEDQELLDKLLLLNPNRHLINDDPKVYDNMPSLLKFKQANELLSQQAYLETKGILTILFSRFLKSNKTGLTETSNVNHRIAAIIKYIRLNLQKEIKVSELANRAHLNVDHFSRLFQESTGLRPVKYIQLCRMERAQLLLVTTTDSLKEIAQKVGLPNQSYFNRLFKSYTNKSPGNYRKSIWNI